MGMNGLAMAALNGDIDFLFKAIRGLVLRCPIITARLTMWPRFPPAWVR